MLASLREFQLWLSHIFLTHVQNSNVENLGYPLILLDSLEMNNVEANDVSTPIDYSNELVVVLGDVMVLLTPFFVSSTRLS